MLRNVDGSDSIVERVEVEANLGMEISALDGTNVTACGLRGQNSEVEVTPQVDRRTIGIGAWRELMDSARDEDT